MACRNAYRTKAVNIEEEDKVSQATITKPNVAKKVSRLLFGVDSEFQANEVLQNHIEQFEWVVRNKIYPNFCGRYLTGVTYEDGKRITTDRNGKQSTRMYDDNGLLVRYTDPNGNSKCYCYDERYNIICETDAKGHSVCKTYNAFNKPTTITDKNGNKTTIIYDSKGNVLKIRYPAIGNLVPQETYTYKAATSR